MFPWRDTPAPEVSTYAVGEPIYSGDHCRGTVVSVDADKATMGVEWNDTPGVITYPMDAPYLRKAMPWETK